MYFKSEKTLNHFLIRLNQFLSFKKKDLVIIFSILFLINCTTSKIKDDKLQSQEPPIEKELKILAVGDVMVHSTQLETAYTKSCDCYEFNEVFSTLPQILTKSDLRIGNLETTLPGAKDQYAGYPQFGAPDSLAEALKNVGFDILTTSNNHCMDKGKKGLRRTIEVLQKLGFHQTGTFIDKDDYEKRRVVLLEKNGFNYVFLAYTYSTNGIPIPKDVHVNLLDKELIARDIEDARKLNPDFIMVYYHFGPEYQRLPSDEQRFYVQHAFMEGADIVLGGHPHVIQPFEKKRMIDKYGDEKERFVIYSLGNFVSSQRYPHTNGGIVLQFSLSKALKGIKIKTIDYDIVIVYRDPLKNKLQFYVVPYSLYGQLDRPKMNKEGEKALMDFKISTDELFRKYSYQLD
jgi:poly-gamma-glutamate capsule biosynthesis protein CapA/YwtB (metallophosphatase superfamily)